jgi:hypothetical protein
MVALKTERRVYLWHVSVRTSPPEAFGKKGVSVAAIAPTLDDVIGILEAEVTGGRARVYLGSGGRLLEDDAVEVDEINQIYIAEIKRAADGETVTLLINRGDPAIVSPAFINAEKKTVRVEEPEENEAPGASAHLVISTKADHGRHRAGFEQMPHVSSSLAMAAIDRMIASALVNNPTYKYEVILKDRKGKPVISWRDYRPVLENHRVPSEKLIDDLDEGQLSSVTLTKKKLFYTGPGVSEIVSRQEEKVVISMKRRDKQPVKEFLKNLTAQAREEQYESISFHVENLPGKATSSPTLTLDDHDAMEQLYVRAQRITGFENILLGCYPSVCDEIEEKMVDLVRNGGW